MTPMTDHNPDSLATDQTWMLRALQWARKGWGRTSPNPMVGAVLVRNGLVVGEGFHAGVGCAHAERMALTMAGQEAKGATAFITLEPCSHFGRTGPCAKALIDAGVKRVVVGTTDPNSKVSGFGLDLLRRLGVDVSVGIEEEACKDLIRPFAWHIRTDRPWVHAKWAMSADGKIASLSGDSKWISGEKSREWVHELRGAVDAVVVGSGTALTDDPLLNARPCGNRTPARILLDRRGRTPVTQRLAQSTAEGPVVLITSKLAPFAWKRAWRAKGVEILVAEDGLNALQEMAQSRGWTEILLEGGAGILGAAFARGIVNEAHVFVGAKILGGVVAPGPIGAPVGDPGAISMAGAHQLTLAQCQVSGPDVRLRYWVQETPTGGSLGLPKTEESV